MLILATPTNFSFKTLSSISLNMDNVRI